MVYYYHVFGSPKCSIPKYLILDNVQKNLIQSIFRSIMSLEWGQVVELMIDTFFRDDCREFKKLSPEMKVFYCYRNLDIKRIISQWMNDNVNQNLKSLKSSALSKDFREEGNRKFRIADDAASLILYSKSVLYAPQGSAELSLALGNRSAVLFRLQKYQECICDIDFAIENFNDHSLFPKLMIRKIKSLSRLKQHEESVRCLNALKEFITKTNDVQCAQKCFEACMNEIRQISTTEENFIKVFEPPKFMRCENNAFPHASDVLELNFQSDSNHHRRVLARETIEPGDIIFVENPFSFVLLPECYEEHCHSCCKPLIAPVACFNCMECLYCNRECMMKAQNDYHQWECQGLNFLRNIGVGHLAFRTFLLKSQNPDSVHSKQIDELVTHLRDVPETDVLSYILTSTLLMIYLEEHSDFTTCCPTLTIEGIGFSLLKCMIQIICNAFAIKKPSNQLSLVTYATGMYPSAAMMNHSCEPNIITSFYDNNLVVRASRRIEMGQEVFNCYGPHYRKMNREKRKEVLTSQFFFNCSCKHCLIDEGSAAWEKTLCLCLECKQPFDISLYNQTMKCDSCSNAIDIRIYLEFFKQATKLREAGMNSKNKGDFENACQLFSQCERLLRTFLVSSSIEIFDNTANLAECYSMLGDSENSWKNFYLNATIASEHFEEFDVEFVAIISRTIDAFLSYFGRENVKKADNETKVLLSLSDKMMKVAEMNFGVWSEEYSSLLEKKKTFTDLEICLPVERGNSSSSFSPDK